jgi:hypothetical protein
MTAAVANSPVQAVAPNALVTASVSGSWAGEGAAILAWSDVNGLPLGTTIGDAVVGNTSETLEVTVTGNAPPNAVWVELQAQLGSFSTAQVGGILTSQIQSEVGAGNTVTFYNPIPSESIVISGT